MPGSHPKGAGMLAAWCSPELTAKIAWLHKDAQDKVPMKIAMAATIRLLLEEAVDRRLPEDVRNQIEEEHRERKVSWQDKGKKG